VSAEEEFGGFQDPSGPISEEINLFALQGIE